MCGYFNNPNSHTNAINKTVNVHFCVGALTGILKRVHVPASQTTLFMLKLQQAVNQSNGWCNCSRKIPVQLLSLCLYVPLGSGATAA